MRGGNASKLVFLGSLYTTQFLALGFFVVALPAVLREGGVPLERIGLIYLAGLAWVFKFLWAPLVDRHGFRRLGHYRGWLLVLQSALAAAILGMTAFDPVADFWWVLAVAGLVSLLSATQDVAADALAVGLLSPEERGLGNGLQAAGGLLGNLLGGGGVLVAYGWIGWDGSMAVLAFAVALPLALVWRHRERPVPVNGIEARPGFGEIARFFLRPGMGWWALLLFAYVAGLNVVYALINPFLVDIGWALARIGVLVTGVGSVLGMAGALLSGYLIRVLGRRRALVLFGLVQAATLAAFLPPALGATTGAPVYLATAPVLLGYGMSLAVLYTIMMDNSRRASAGTDYTVQASLVAFGGVAAGGAGAALAGALGYAAVVPVGVGLTLLAVLGAARLELREPAADGSARQERAA